MILSSLVEYYDRRAADPATALPAEGWERKRLPFLVDIRRDGSFVQFADTRARDGTRLIATEYLVPQAPKRAVNIAACLLWDNVEYALGVPVGNDPARVARAHQAFRDLISATFGDNPADDGVRAVCRFLDAIPRDALRADPAWEEVSATNPFITFRLAGDALPISMRPGVGAAVVPLGGTDVGRCLVGGGRGPIARLHTSIKGVRGANTVGASIVSFNLAAFESYGRVQGANAPVSVDAAFKYTTALNHLLRSDSPQRQLVADTTFVYWAQRAEDASVEEAVSLIFSDPVRDDPDRNVAVVETILGGIRTGAKATGDDAAGRFYVLGLAPNAARLAVRLWVAASAGTIGQRIVQHFDDLAIVRPPKSHPYPSLYWLLRSVAVLGRADNIPPALEGDISRAALEGLPYPRSLLSAAVGRCRAEQDVTPDRASLIKAVINRSRRAAGRGKEELTVALDPANPDPGYRLGRLFAALERAQEIASPGLNSTIRDRFYGAASSTPITVFPRLLSLKNHHVAKIEPAGIRVWMERLLGDIVDGLPAIPSHLTLEQQGAFAVGYYHQRQDFYRKRTTESGEDTQA